MITPPVFGNADPALPTPVFAVEETPLQQSVPYFSLSWEVPGEADGLDPDVFFEVEVASSERFGDPGTYYRGPDVSSFVSGLAEGDYFYRIRTYREGGAAGAWSDPLHVIIQYDSLTQAFLLFGLGAVVSIATVALVVVGDRRTRREAEADA